ncbi:hypothetical protein BsIDN1_50890 [Bacillus safensis]|uniref:histidine kinase n=1 Tax=Bacillus safensis TaxID=561879 RepID=A0A5S9MEU2_BACIA|nr:hypothetical protein BsIDN1_50890 [Bacillus safensis]
MIDDKEALTQFLSIILKESVRLETLIQDLLDLSKIEQQHFKLNIQDANATEIIQEIEVLLKQKRAAEKRHSTTSAYPERACLCDGRSAEVKTNLPQSREQCPYLYTRGRGVSPFRQDRGKAPMNLM